MKEPRKVRWNVLSTIEYVCTHIKGKQLKYEKTPKFQKYLERLSLYFGGVNEIQVIFLCACTDIILSKSSTGICEYWGISPLKYYRYNKEIEDLERRGFIYFKLEKDGHSTYDFKDDILSFILHNTEINIEEERVDSIAFVTKIRDILEGYEDQFKTWNQQITAVYETEKRYSDLKFVKDVKKQFKDRYERFCFYCICYNYQDGGSTKIQPLCANVYNHSKVMMIKQFLSGDYPLLKRGFIDFVVKGNLLDSTVTITEKSKDLFLGEDKYLYERTVNEKSLIIPDQIVSKQLFYSKDNQTQINALYSSLTTENLVSIQNGLKAKGFPTGICILLYGAPGTGKTESVYQIAKVTNRKIYHVDISQTKSCWFGESEKKIQEIFDNYKRMCERLRIAGRKDTPILLFNEADAILQKRTEFRGGGAEKTENAMQNILLENLEKFDGIMIATTNLEINMDAAFERRFLYKIKFENPTIEAKTAIWQSKLNWLPEEQAKQLANEYNFSGGEIDNVVRKATMEEILNGSKVTMNRLEELCNSEKLISSNSGRKMGFCM